ncbi:MAG TPA: MmcQ/YjbR family DNA-binding protein [Candidatus Thermoplasmatota archaeon]|nr:MmcQ/YjbR family DNA-binding protein [Candidatus Thermoplasmatota archaeon]
MPARKAPPPPQGKAKPAPTRPAAKASPATKHAGKRHDPALAARFRRLALSYPEAVEVEQFGEPWFKVGKKAFCTYGAEGGQDGASFSLSPMDQSELIKDPRFERTHYIGQHGWTTMRFDGQPDWDEVAQLVDIAYRRVAPRRLVLALPD